MNTKLDIQRVESLWQEALPVKANSYREIRRTETLYIKSDRRFLHGFSREIAAAKKLRAAGLPVVDHLFSGRGKNGHYLVTSAFPGGIPVSEYLQRNIPDMKFFRSIADLILQMHDAGFLHTDFHPGNLLYSPAENSFMLVDVRRVKKLPFWLLTRLPERVKFHLLTEFRGVLKKKDLLKLFRRVGICNPRIFYENMFFYDNKMIRKEWKRRREQILAGYRKFTRREEDTLFNTSANETEIAGAEIIPGGKAVFLAGFFLDLIQIPHRKVVRYDAGSDTTYALPVKPGGKPEGELAIEMIQRMFFYDIHNSAPDDWSMGANELPQFNALNKVAEKSFILEK